MLNVHPSSVLAEAAIIADPPVPIKALPGLAHLTGRYESSTQHAFPLTLPSLPTSLSPTRGFPNMAA